MPRRRFSTAISAMAIGIAIATGIATQSAMGDAGHDHANDNGQKMLEQMKKLHGGHDHQHNFEAMEGVTEESMERVVNLMMDVGLALPPLDSRRGRKLFLDKGCIVCHQVNGVGGAIGPSLNAADMPQPMNAFEFAARMWRGAPAMVEMQNQILGEAISLTGEELADIIAFAHDGDEQGKLTAAQIPARYRDLIVK